MSLRLIDQTGDPAGGEGRGDDHRAVALRPLRAHLRAAEHHAVNAAGDGPVDDLRLVAADEDAVRIGQGLILVLEGQHDVHFAGDAVPGELVFVDERTLQHAQQVEDRHVVHPVLVQGLHVVGGDIAGGEHAEEAAVFIHDGDHVDGVVPHGLPGQVDRDGVVQRGRGVKFQIPDLGAHVLDQRRRLHPEMIQQALGLIVDGADAHGLVLPVAKGVAQLGIGHGGDDGIGIRVAVAGNVNIAHGSLLIAVSCSIYLIIE